MPPARPAAGCAGGSLCCNPAPRRGTLRRRWRQTGSLELMRTMAWMAGAWLASAAVMAADAPAGAFTLTSSDIRPGGTIAAAQVFNSFGCSGGNVSPALAWSGVPAGTQSFALMVHDPDAPTGSGWWHWVVYNIPAG